MEITLKVGPKGQIVIPKFIRENLGILEKGNVTLSVSEKTVSLKSAQKDIVTEWQAQAEKTHKDVSKWIHGDSLYEEEFS